MDREWFRKVWLRNMEAEQLLSGEEQEDDLEESEQVEASDPADNVRAKQRCSTFVKIFFGTIYMIT